MELTDSGWALGKRVADRRDGMTNMWRSHTSGIASFQNAVPPCANTNAPPAPFWVTPHTARAL